MPQFRASDGASLAYRDDGAGLPLLCLPGLTRTLADFDYLAPHLPPLRLIRMDYRGRGGSDWTGPATYTVEQEARDVLALLDHLGLAAAAILGASRGGLIGMLLGAVAKDRVLGLCLNDIGPKIAQPGLQAIFDRVGRQPEARSRAEHADRLSRNPAFPGVPLSRWQAEAAKQVQDTPEGLRLTYDPSLGDAFRAGVGGPPVTFWPQFDALSGLPLAVIRGANSDLLSAATVADMQARRPDMDVTEVPDRGHMPFLDELPAVALIHRFLRRLQ